MRGAPFMVRRTATVMLLIINAAVFLGQLIVWRFGLFDVDAWLALSLDGLKHGYVWQLLSYQFLHGGTLHLLLNCWALYVFGQEVEDALGRKSFLALYFSSGIIGGLFQATAAMLAGGAFAGPVVGASAAVFGLVAAFAILFPDRVLLLFFIIPMQARLLLWISAFLAVVGMVLARDGIAHAAHLGGMVAGFLFVRYATQWTWPEPGRFWRRSVRRRARAGAAARSASRADDEDLSPDEFVSREVDPILDKISAHGIQSLTERERRILEEAREKVCRR